MFTYISCSASSEYGPLRRHVSDSQIGQEDFDQDHPANSVEYPTTTAISTHAAEEAQVDDIVAQNPEFFANTPFKNLEELASYFN